MWRSLALVLVFVSAFPTVAAAQSTDHRDEIAALEKQLDQPIALSGAADCAEACRALGSMRRAADRLCTLDPGDRCKQARAKVSAATERVRAACPSCDAATVAPTATPTPGVAPPPPQPVQDQSGSKTESQVVTTSADAPRKGGGCAGCSVAHHASPAGAIVVAIALLGALARRRRAPL